MQSAALKEAIDDLEWPGSSVQITLQPAPPSVMFKGEGHGDLQVQLGLNNEDGSFELTNSTSTHGLTCSADRVHVLCKYRSPDCIPL